LNLLRKYFAIGVCFGVCGLPLAAQGPGRQQMRAVLQALDLDHDGTLSAAEIQAAPASLRALDTNGDGTITSDELSTRPEVAGATADEMVQQLMGFDKTGKGYLVLADLPARMQGVFQRADTDHDGKLTPAEIRGLGVRQGMPAGPVAAPGHASGMFRTDALLNSLDTNHDGVISADEIAAASASLLTLDKNGDGQITPDEMAVRQQTAEERAAHMLMRTTPIETAASRVRRCRRGCPSSSTSST
jgi:Ca2+-binding EF-hand superfamily protein